MNAITVRRYGMMTRYGSIGVRRVVNHQRKNPPTKRGTRATASTPTSRDSRKSHEPTNSAMKRTDVIRGEGAGSGLAILNRLRRRTLGYGRSSERRFDLTGKVLFVIGAQLRADLVRSFFLDKVFRAAQDACAMIGKEPLEPLALGGLERSVLAPENESWLVGQPGEVGFHLSQVFATVKDFPRKDRGRPARGPRGKGATVGPHFRRRETAADARWQEHVDERVDIEDEKAADRAAHDSRKPLEAIGALSGPGPRVADEQGAYPLGMPPGNAEPDRPAPVLNHQSDVVEVQCHQELLEHGGVLPRLETVSRSGRAEAKAGVVHGHAAEPR